MPLILDMMTPSNRNIFRVTARPFVRGIHRSPVNSPHKGQWRGALMFSLIYAWTNGWVNNREAGDLRRYHVHYNATLMQWMRKIHELLQLYNRYIPLDPVWFYTCVTDAIHQNCVLALILLILISEFFFNLLMYLLKTLTNNLLGK